MEIQGTDAFLDQIPGWWHRFGTILSFRYGRVLDCETWLRRYDGELILTDTTEEVQLRLALKNVRGEWTISVGQTISGLQILDTREWGVEPETRYHIRDFECGDIDLFCEDIQVEILEGEARYEG